LKYDENVRPLVAVLSHWKVIFLLKATFQSQLSKETFQREKVRN